jgi:hypothetical protein
LPARRTDFRLAYGRPAIVSAALLLRALIKVEQRLGAAPGDSLFTCLCLADLRENSYVTVEGWETFGLRARDWQEAVAQAAGRKMDLSPPERPSPRPSLREGFFFSVKSRPLSDEEARTHYMADR